MTNLTRRGFLKGTGMAAGAMAFTSFAPMSVASSNQRGKGILTAGRCRSSNCFLPLIYMSILFGNSMQATDKD